MFVPEHIACRLRFPPCSVGSQTEPNTDSKQCCNINRSSRMGNEALPVGSTRAALCLLRIFSTMPNADDSFWWLEWIFDTLLSVKAPLHFLKQSCNQISCSGKPVERTNRTGLEIFSFNFFFLLWSAPLISRTTEWMEA